LGFSITITRRWEREGKLVSVHTAGGHRRDDLAKWCPARFRAAADVTRKTVAYARASSHDQKDDRDRPKQVQERDGARQGWTFEVVADLGSGTNDHKTGLKRLLNDILPDLVMTHKDRLLRLGAKWVFAVGEVKQVEVVIRNPGKDTTLEEERVQNVWEIMTVISARLYGSCVWTNQTW